ncbi:MAG TPA: TonB-dependent receptor [Fodinibius sp.]|nr:TonB-dependent receptor [Fodinibius sp.]
MLSFCLTGSLTQAQTLGSLYPPTDKIQHREVTIEKNMALTQAMEKLEEQFNVAFLYRTDALAGKKIAQRIVIADNVKEALTQALSGQNLDFKYLNPKTYGIFAGKKPSEQQQPPSSLQEEITGSVTDANSGQTLPGVNILVKGTTTGASTDADGNFELTVPSLQDTLVVTYIGYQRQEVPINGRTSLSIQLNPEAIMGEEMVVVGYGTRQKKTLTGSVSAISSEELSKAPVTNVSNSIGGRLPGVITTTGSGEPGYDNSDILIRGQQTLNNNNPLVVIDGIPSSEGALSRLNPQDIEDMSVLKDASAAIYGSQAANGVILVTTKRGTKGKPQFTINFNQGFTQPTRVPEMADAPTYLQMLNEIDIYQGAEPRYSQKEINKYKNIDEQDPWLYHDTDWFDAALKPLSLQTKASASMAGGSENLQYRVSFGALTEDGFYRNSATHYDQYNFRSNIDGQINKNINLRFDVSGRYESRNFPMQGAGTTFATLMRGKPHQPAYWPNGKPAPAIERGENPVVTGTDATGKDKDDWYYLNSQLSLDIKVPGVEGLNLRGTFSYNKAFRQRKAWLTPWTLYDFNEEDYKNKGGDPEQYLSGSLQPPGQDPQLTQYNENNNNILLNAVAEYQTDIADHSINVLAGVEKRSNDNAYFNAFRRHYISTALDELFAGGEAQRANDGSSSQEAWLSFFSRIGYNYQNKYMVDLIGRYDGSYKFPEGQRYGFFPSVSVGWRISEEDFFRNNIGFLDDLKIRASWGQTGNDRIDPYQFMAGYGFGDGYVLGGQEVKSLYQTRTPNPAITWEVANQRDIGLEGALLDNRLSFEVDYFNYLRKDILTQRNASVPESSGLILPEENIGEVSSYGFDGNINWRQDVSEDFIYNITLNLGWATNEINYWDEPPGAPDWQKSTGHKMNTELFYVADGVFNDQAEVESRPHWAGAQAGDLIFKDVNGDGEITADDRVRIDRNSIPEWTGGLTFSGNYKQFDMSVFFQGAAGASQYVRTSSGEFGNYLAEFARKRWTPDHRNSEGPRAFNREEEYWIAQNNTYFYKKTDYIRLKTLELGYNFPNRLIERWGVQNLRIYLSGYNLLTWDTFGLMDPEASSDSGGYYPQKRVFNAGISLTF